MIQIDETVVTTRVRQLIDQLRTIYSKLDRLDADNIAMNARAEQSQRTDAIMNFFVQECGARTYHGSSPSYAAQENARHHAEQGQLYARLYVLNAEVTFWKTTLGDDVVTEIAAALQRERTIERASWAAMRTGAAS